MLFTDNYTVREANLSDHNTIVTSLNSALVHQHLDWETLQQQINSHSVFLCYRNDDLLGTLSLAGGDVNNQWVKLFSVINDSQSLLVWNKLLAYAFANGKNPPFYTIGIWDWYKRLINADKNFSLWDKVVVLECELDTFSPGFNKKDSAIVKELNIADIPDIYHIDKKAFSTPWQLSENNLTIALQDSKIALQSQRNGKMVGYLLATYDAYTAHLSRIAVHPSFTHSGYGSLLMEQMLSFLRKESIHTITVNTQEGNSASLQLYKKYGFTLTDENIPVYCYNPAE